MPIPKRNNGESTSAFMNRCMANQVMLDEYENERQRYAVCMANLFSPSDTKIVSMDYDGVLSTAKGKELAKELIKKGFVLYIISARSNKEPMLKTADELGIPHSRVFATGSNKAKIEKVQMLNAKHYDNNPDVIRETEGELFT